MKIKFEFDKCIYCLENPADSWEHIIPESIGGRLQVRALCSECNNKKLGSKLISKARNDPSIRLAVWNLKDEIPELFEAIENGQLYFAKDNNDNLVRLRYKNSTLELVAESKEAGSFIVDSEKAIKKIAQMLKKDGLSEQEIALKIRSYEEMDENKNTQLTPRVKVAKLSIGPPSQFLQGPLLNEKVIVLMVYEFLSLLIGNLIYDDKMDFVRKFIKEGENSKNIVIEHLTPRHYGPYHEIFPQLTESEIIINIILFEWLVYKVRLKGLSLSSPTFVYLEDLKRKKPLWAKSVDEAKQSIWHDFQN